jgi:solute carrier family 25 carnitine/acylcarnitine transporter 20/29
MMTTYFILVDRIRSNTNAFDYKIGQFLVSGGCATFAFWVIWPFETLKNQMQAGTKNIGNTWLEKIRYMQKTHGITGIYRGILPGSLSICARNGSAMVMMQYAQKTLTEKGYRKPK